MTIFEFIYNALSIVAIIDLIIVTIQIRRDFFILYITGISETVKIKRLIEKVVMISYITYWIYKILVWKGVI